MASIVNIKRIIDVSTSVSSSAAARRDFTNTLFVFKGAQVGTSRLNLATSVTEATDIAGSNSEVVKAATTFFAGGFNGIRPTNFYFANIDTAASTPEVFETVFAELLKNPTYYIVCLDRSFTSAETKLAMDMIEASTSIRYYGFILDTIDTAETEDVATDVTSLTAYGFSKKFTHNAVIYSDSALATEYHNVAAASYFAIVQMTAARPLGSLAHKQFSGITASTLGASTTASSGYDNIVAKNGNVYVNFGEVGRTIMEKGNCGKGSDISDYIAADYADYSITYNIFDLLIRLPKLPFTSEGKSKLYTAISAVFEDLKSAGVIAGGTDMDTGIEMTSGYSIDIPLPVSAANKAAGLWTGIICTGLLSGVGKKFVITNELKV